MTRSLSTCLTRSSSVILPRRRIFPPAGRGVLYRPHPGRARSPRRQKREVTLAEIYARPALRVMTQRRCAAELAACGLRTGAGRCAEIGAAGQNSTIFPICTCRRRRSSAMLRRCATPSLRGLRLLHLRCAEAQRQTVQTVFARDGTGRQAGAFHRGQLAPMWPGPRWQDNFVASAHRPPGV